MIVTIPAEATVTGHDSFHISDTRTFTDIGCREQDQVTLAEDVQGHLVVVNGGLRVNALMAGTITFSEEGQVFLGRFAYPFTLIAPADGSVEVSQTYTATAMGDAGDVAVLHVTAHVRYVAPIDTVTSDLVIVHQSCR
jgi:hypothetical protein